MSLQDELDATERTARDMRALLEAHPDAERVNGEIVAASLRPEQCTDYDLFRETDTTLTLVLRREFGDKTVRMPPAIVGDVLYRLWVGKGHDALCGVIAEIVAEKDAT